MFSLLCLAALILSTFLNLLQQSLNSNRRGIDEPRCTMLIYHEHDWWQLNRIVDALVQESLSLLPEHPNPCTHIIPDVFIEKIQVGDVVIFLRQ